MWLSEFVAGEFTCWTKKEFHSMTFSLTRKRIPLVREKVLDVFFKVKKPALKVAMYNTCGRKKLS